MLPLGRGIPLLLLCLFSTLATTGRPLEAQLFERATVLDNVQIRLSETRTIEGARVVIKGGRITEIGTDVSKPLLSRTVDGGGGTLTAGAIALSSQLTLGRSRKALPNARAWDGFDRYDTDAIALALSGGVTTVCLTPRGTPGIVGLASVVRLAPREEGGLGTLLEDEVALCIDLASANSALARLRTLRTVEKQFEDAVVYRESLDLYSEDLEKYVEALEKEEDASGSEENEEKKNLHGADAGAGKSNGKKNGGEKKDAPKKPNEPKARPDLDVILRAIDREIPVRITAHRSADILNAIELAKQYDLELILEGASEAHLVIESIAAAKAAVLLFPAPAGEDAERSLARRRARDLPDRLAAAEIPWHFAPGSTVHELLPDALRTCRGSRRDALGLLTRDASRLLGLGRRAGRLGRGVPADLVLWSADPVTDPTARVEQVWVGGRSAFRAAIGLETPPAENEKKKPVKKEAL